MTPADWALFVEGWNEAHEPSEPQAPSWEELQELKAKYG
jgi:hypothetical protein